MKIGITGGSGFVGQHLVTELLKNKHELILVVRSISSCQSFHWYNCVQFLEFDLLNDTHPYIISELSQCDKIIHLAWYNLPNYKELFHFEVNLMSQYFFLKKIVESGVKDLTITGTCLEYGNQPGCLSVDMKAEPNNPYALAKFTLHNFLLELQKKQNFTLKWLRLFYMYGEGQSGNSILPQLEKAILNKEIVFNLSGGEQLRDYLHISDVVKQIQIASIEKNCSGIFNVCSGIPISVKNLVENHLKIIGKKINLNFGFYPYNDYEPMEFWGKKDL